MNKVLTKSVVLFLTFITFSVMLLYLSSNIRYQAATSKKLIYLDPGHGGFDGGCINNELSIIEKDIVLDISLKLKNILERSGYLVLLTRESDISLADNKREDILKRVSLINDSNAICFVSIHANSYPSKQISGAQSFYKKEDSLELAKLIQENIQKIDIKNDRKTKKLDGKYLLDHVNKIGCLVEVGFLSNDNEAKRLKNDFYQTMIAYAVYLGITEYIQNGE